MLFPDLKDYQLPAAEKAVLGGSARFEITRENPIDCMFLVLDVTFSTGSAQANADGILQLVKRVTMNAPDGARNRMVLDMSGPGLVEYAYHVNDNSLARWTRAALNYGGTAIAIAAATYRIVYPIFFCPPNVGDPISSNFLLPVDRYNNNPVLDVQYASQADLDIHGVATAAISAIASSLFIVRRQINRANWPIVDHELIESESIFVASSSGTEVDLPVGGYLTGLLMRCISRTSATPPVESRADVSTGGPWELKVNQNTRARFRLADLEILNDHSASNAALYNNTPAVIAAASNPRGYIAGSYFLNFVNNRPGGDSGDPAIALRSCLNLNVAAASGVRVFMREDISVPSGGSVRVRHITHRFYANLDELQVK